MINIALHGNLKWNIADKERMRWHRITRITMFLFAFYALKTAWLAFDEYQYSHLFYYVGELLVIFCLPCAALSLLKTWNNRITANIALLLLPWINWLYIVLHSYGENDYLRATYTFFVIYAFILFPASLKRDIFNVFYRIVLITNVISLLLYCFYILGINIGFREVPYYTSEPATYVKWFIFAIFKNRAGIRLCGIFNEPGGLGTICALIFIARYGGMRIGEKVIFLLSIVLSRSMAGFLLLFGFIILNLIYKNTRYIFLIIPLVCVFLILPYVKFNNEILNQFIARLRLTANGFVGDNRTKGGFDLLYESFLHGNKVLFGYGAGYVAWGGVLSYKTYIVQYGIIGFGFWIITWIRAGLNNARKNKDCILFLLLFLVSLYQRPALLESIYGYVLLFGGMEWIRNNSC